MTSDKHQLRDHLAALCDLAACLLLLTHGQPEEPAVPTWKDPRYLRTLTNWAEKEQAA